MDGVISKQRLNLSDSRKKDTPSCQRQWNILLQALARELSQVTPGKLCHCLQYKTVQSTLIRNTFASHHLKLASSWVWDAKCVFEGGADWRGIRAAMCPTPSAADPDWWFSDTRGERCHRRSNWSNFNLRRQVLPTFVCDTYKPQAKFSLHKKVQVGMHIRKSDINWQFCKYNIVKNMSTKLSIINARA